MSRMISSTVTEDCLYVTTVSTFLIVKLSSILSDPIDPFKPVEDLICFVALGGLWQNLESSGNMEE